MDRGDQHLVGFGRRYCLGLSTRKICRVVGVAMVGAIVSERPASLRRTEIVPAAPI